MRISPRFFSNLDEKFKKLQVRNYQYAERLANIFEPGKGRYEQKTAFR